MTQFPIDRIPLAEPLRRSNLIEQLERGNVFVRGPQMRWLQVRAIGALEPSRYPSLPHMFRITIEFVEHGLPSTITHRDFTNRGRALSWLAAFRATDVEDV